MLNQYDIVVIKEDHSFKNKDGKTIVIPKGMHGLIVEKYDDGLIVELINRGDELPLTYDFQENELELYKKS